MRCLIRFDSFRNVLAGVGILGNPPGRPLLGAMRTQGFTLGYSRFLPPGGGSALGLETQGLQNTSPKPSNESERRPST